MSLKGLGVSSLFQKLSHVPLLETFTFILNLDVEAMCCRRGEGLAAVVGGRDARTESVAEMTVTMTFLATDVIGCRREVVLKIFLALAQVLSRNTAGRENSLRSGREGKFLCRAY